MIMLHLLSLRDVASYGRTTLFLSLSAKSSVIWEQKAN